MKRGDGGEGGVVVIVRGLVKGDWMGASRRGLSAPANFVSSQYDAPSAREKVRRTRLRPDEALRILAGMTQMLLKSKCGG